MKCKGRPKKFWLAQVDFLKKELGPPRQSPGHKNSKIALDERECEEF